VEQNGNVLLTPLVGDHVVEMGTLEDFPVKLRNVKAFYEQVMARNQWDKYGQISVKYKNQVIAKKR
jgi:cell division protein FtsQ